MQKDFAIFWNVLSKVYFTVPRYPYLGIFRRVAFNFKKFNRTGGIAELRKAGISVVTDVLKKQCDEFNEAFFHYMRTGLPFVTVKTAVRWTGRSRRSAVTVSG